MSNEISQRHALILDAVRRLLRRGAMRNMAKMVNKMHPAEVAKMVRHLDDASEKRIVFGLVAAVDGRAELLRELDRDSALEIYLELDRTDQLDILNALESDDAADLLGVLPADLSGMLLELMPTAESDDVVGLLGYPEETAGGIMTPDCFSCRVDTPVASVIELLQQEADAEMVFYVYVVDEDNVLRGVLSLRELLTVPPDTQLGEVMQTSVVRAGVHTDQEEVARLTARYNLLAVPVVDTEEHLVGIITVDDVIDVIREEATEDIMKMVGTSGDTEEYTPSVGSFRAVRMRLPWLLVNVAGGIAGAWVLAGFADTLEAALMLAGFIPISMALGGSLGMQSATIMVRGLATGHIEMTDVRRVFFREVQVGALVGIVCGTLVGVVALLWHTPWLGLVIGISLFAASLVAVITGTLAPVVFEYLRIDPAISSGPLVTMLNDLTGLVIYLGLATALLGYLAPAL